MTITNCELRIEKTRGPRADLRAWQTDRFRELVRCVVSTNSFWTGKWHAAEVDLSDAAIDALRVPDDLAKFPPADPSSDETEPRRALAQ